MRHTSKVRYALVVMMSLTLVSCNDDVSFATKSVATANASGVNATRENRQGPVEPSVEIPKTSVPEMHQIVKTFSTTQLGSTSLAFTPSHGVLKQEFSLVSRYENTDRAFSQISRQNVSKIVRQGTPGIDTKDTLRQADHGILDLLIVVDDSGSMSQEQVNLSGKLTPLLEYIKNSDWRIGVVTTDPAKGCSRALIKKGDANINQAFAAAINAGLAGSGNEQGIRQAVAGLSCASAPFVRPKSTVAVLIVSDEDNCSDGKGCAAPFNSHTYLTDFLANDLGRNLGSDARIYGLFWEPGKQCSGAAIRGSQYAAAVAATQGTVGSICDSDYTATLLRISQDVSTILKADFTLSAQPDNGSATVKVNGVAKSSGFSIVGNVLSFSELPPKAASIEVTYSVGSVPMKMEYDLGEIPADGTLKVQINGAMVSSNDYTVTNKSLKFNTMPAANADIKIDFLRNTTLLNKFAIGEGIKEGTLKVRVNGGLVSDYDADPSGFLQFRNPPLDGSLITVNFERYLGPQLAYVLPLAGSGISVVGAYDKESAEAVMIGISPEGAVIVEEKDHKDEKTIVLLYKNETYKAGEISFDYPVIPDSVVVESSNPRCAVNQGVEITESVLRIDCDLLEGEDAKVTFQYKQLITDFVVPELTLWHADSSVKVFVNSLEVRNFIVAGEVVSLSGDVPYDAVVRIQVNGTHH